MRTKRRSLQPRPAPLAKVSIDKKREPVFENVSDINETVGDFSEFEVYLTLWMIFRKTSAHDQVVPTFSGFGVQERSFNINATDLEKTHLTYLPPINASITNFDTIYKLFKTLQTMPTIA